MQFSDLLSLLISFALALGSAIFLIAPFFTAKDANED